MFERKLIFRKIAKTYIDIHISTMKYRKSMLPRLNELRSTDELTFMLRMIV